MYLLRTLVKAHLLRNKVLLMQTMHGYSDSSRIVHHYKDVSYLFCDWLVNSLQLQVGISCPEASVMGKHDRISVIFFSIENPVRTGHCTIAMHQRWLASSKLLPQICQMYLQDTQTKLTIKVKSLEDVKAMMAVLSDVREKEAAIDDIIGPVENIYSMLASYEACSA